MQTFASVCIEVRYSDFAAVQEKSINVGFLKLFDRRFYNRGLPLHFTTCLINQLAY